MKMVHFLVALGVAFLFLLGAVVLRSPDHVQVTIELLKVIIAWPPIFLFLALLFMKRYPTEIRSFLGRAIKFGPVEAERQLPPQKLPEAELAIVAAEVSQGEQSSAAGKPRTEPKETVAPSGDASKPSSEAQDSNGPETVEIPKSLLRYIALEREAWKFQFLNQFLVHNTKSVLAWFAQRPSATLEEYDRTWRFSIPEPEQRARVVDALLQYGLLRFGEKGLEITDEGQRALDHFVHHWPLPFAPPSPMPLGATGATGVSGPTGPTGPILGNLGFGPPSALESLRRVAAEHSAKPPEPGSILEALIKRKTARKEGTAAPEPTPQKGLLFDND